MLEAHDDEAVWRSELPFHPGDDDAALAPFCPTPRARAVEGCQLARVGAGDVVFDLGCGDGACLCEIAVATGARCVGVEFDEQLASAAAARVKELGLEALVSIVQEDARSVDLSTATCIWVFLSPGGLAEMSDVFVQHLERGGRIISYTFPLPISPKYMQATGTLGNLFVYAKEPIS